MVTAPNSRGKYTASLKTTILKAVGGAQCATEPDDPLAVRWATRQARENTASETRGLLARACWRRNYTTGSNFCIQKRNSETWTRRKQDGAKRKLISDWLPREQGEIEIREVEYRRAITQRTKNAVPVAHPQEWATASREGDGPRGYSPGIFQFLSDVEELIHGPSTLPAAYSRLRRRKNVQGMIRLSRTNHERDTSLLTCTIAVTE